MAWELRIHHIDVGRGESALIVARDPAIPLQRSLLIDGGLPSYGETVHDYLFAHLNGQALDRIVVTHFDNDHHGGITSLLIADTQHRQCELLANATGDAAFAAAGATQLHQICAAAAACVAASFGAHGTQAQHAVAAGANSQAGLGANTPLAAADHGIAYAENNYQNNNALVQRLIPIGSTLLRRQVARSAGIAAGSVGGAAAAKRTAAMTAIYNRLQTTVLPVCRFQTGGDYANVDLIDIGNNTLNALPPQNFVNAVGGTIMLSQNNLVSGERGRRISTEPVQAEVRAGIEQEVVAGWRRQLENSRTTRPQARGQLPAGREPTETPPLHRPRKQQRHSDQPRTDRHIEGVFAGYRRISTIPCSAQAMTASPFGSCYGPSIRTTLKRVVSKSDSDLAISHKRSRSASSSV